ncbi:hypothetical protein RhiirA5_495368 [Rhizophagus irregularis]|uniref:Uncharacterized protein n=4 Tax=Rhizophagus irregularis TaxID=588596 RepID=A0A2I1E1B2_9GLOM|nr:hypothetical protein GLOIN_2v1483581 [Rhizophagus irregularis DAOM 181602=DAOM 197198]EXX72067.1 hypothetical protein RirG_072820 [Rhizophagus irregularis DAOM 197198w]PKC14458.1 hypothetical protein RhiirA5_495368 [Rhizophagus irregularis]PKC73613.1 hypothetical protein RhiirA1_437462 [Rhizophagus irregularis]PKY15909.1 hypothetical protein RhiirB3_478814 [Rhizophagus irregularis]POG64814.1 hypothetical protein GLOIN_2v1483581 [Rhizophagus irregularis DAOM 181602=DAOM 197198]|eukprot:XP_025171680.1 hypothetical protein GLOIN_2v1483581 [Rhizophagus irregularis DAOM 181602=DAOM 197198]
MSKKETTEEYKVFTTSESKGQFGGTSRQFYKRNEEKSKVKPSFSTPSTSSVEEKSSSASSTSIEESSTIKPQSNYESEEQPNKSDDDDQTSITTFSSYASPASSNTDYGEESASSNNIMRIQNILNDTLAPLFQPLQTNTHRLQVIEPHCEPRGPESPKFPFLN